MKNQETTYVDPPMPLRIALLIILYVVCIGLTQSIIWGILLALGVYIIIFFAYNACFREKQKKFDEQTKDFDIVLSLINKSSPHKTEEYYKHYSIDPYKIDEYTWVPQYLRDYMKKEYEVWNQLGHPYNYQGIRVTSAASIYGREYAQQKMIEDRVGLPGNVFDSFGVYEHLEDRLWQEWKRCKYESYAAAYRDTGKFNAPWLPVTPDMPDWYYEKHPEEKPY